MASLRLIVVAVLVALLAGGVLLLKHWDETSAGPFGDAEDTVIHPASVVVKGEHWSNVSYDATTLWQNNDNCLACHPGQAAEWRGTNQRLSLHFWSFHDPLYRQQVLSGGGGFDCLACHLSANIYDNTLGKTPPSKKVPKDYDATHPLPGVSCLTCHAKGESVMATRTIPGAPCNPVAEPTLSTATLCQGCHMAYAVINTKHEYEEWLERDPRNAPMHCVDCHMDPVTRSPALGLPQRGGRHHGFHVMHNPELFNQFFSAYVERVGDQFELVLENKGTAHRFPSGYTIKSVVVRLQGHLDREDGAEVIHRYEIRKSSPFGGVNTQLKDFEIRRLPLPDLTEYGPILLDCLYKTSLSALDGETEPFYSKLINLEELTTKRPQNK